MPLLILLFRKGYKAMLKEYIPWDFYEYAIPELQEPPFPLMIEGQEQVFPFWVKDNAKKWWKISPDGHGWIIATGEGSRYKRHRTQFANIFAMPVMGELSNEYDPSRKSAWSRVRAYYADKKDPKIMESYGGWELYLEQKLAMAVLNLFYIIKECTTLTTSTVTPVSVSACDPAQDDATDKKAEV